MDIEQDQTATNLEFVCAKVLEQLGEPKPVGKPPSGAQIHPSLDHRVDPEDLRLPGLVSEIEWDVAEKLTMETEATHTHLRP